MEPAPQPHNSRPTTPPLLVSIADATRLLSLSRSTIYELIWQGEFCPVRIGRCVRLRYEELESFVDRQLGPTSTY